MQNYIVRSLYKLDSGELGILPSHYQVYKKMHEYSVQSFYKYITGEWDLILFEGSAPNPQEMFKDVFKRTYNLWLQQNCNILFIDLDILVLKEFYFFQNPPQNFTMYDLNCGFRYFPQVMDPGIWKLANQKFLHWPNNKWDFEQDLYISMLNNRQIPGRSPILQAPFNFHEIDSNYSMVHLHGSQTQ
jgi:hypothetical protein